LEPERDLPLPPILAERKEVTIDLLAEARRSGIGFITGSTGCGKTTVARLTARAHGSQWSIVDLRDASAEQTAQRLDLALGALGLSGSAGIILDDLNEIEVPQARRALSRFLSTLRRRDILCLMTAYRKPSSRAFSELGVDESTHFAVSDLAESEVAAMVSASGGDAKKWAAAVQRASALGHPQLVQAVISGLRARGWPDEELKSLRAFDPSSDIEAERLAARNRLVAVLPKESSTLLYRVSLLFGRCDRSLRARARHPSRPVDRPVDRVDRSARHACVTAAAKRRH
jgi:energy-coupling factor transporter ATP-binding protein EcfA2